MTIIQKQAILFRIGVLPLSGVDGIWGEKSQKATASMQQDLGLEPDGIWGKQTDAAVEKALSLTATEHTNTWWDEIEYFVRDEFRCKCGGKYCDGFSAEPQEKLIRVADRVRKNIGGAVTVTSGVRCSRHNSNVGGVSNSRHLAGKAMDFCVAGKSATQVLTYVQSQPEIRYAYAIDGTFVHMDIE